MRAVFLDGGVVYRICRRLIKLAADIIQRLLRNYALPVAGDRAVFDMFPGRQREIAAMRRREHGAGIFVSKTGGVSADAVDEGDIVIVLFDGLVYQALHEPLSCDVFRI